jgi:DNA-binding response OmpR family regulator
VLVVDDDPQVRQVIQWALEDEGFAVLTAGDGRAALGVIRDQRPDLLVLDLTLPEMNGDELIRSLGAGGPGLGIPVLLVTADGQAPAKAARVGAYTFLRKPFQLDELLAAVSAGLRRD